MTMFDYIFENRDKKVANLLRLGDCLGRCLRENVVLFSIDDSHSRVSYITESEKIISGDYDLKNGIELDFIVVENFDVYTEENKFDNFVNNKVSMFVESLYSDDYSDAQTNFSDILDTWKSRIKFDSVKEKLHEKVSKFNSTQDILSTPEFHNFLENTPQLSQFLKENADSVIKIPEIVNGIKLSNTVAQAFNLPRTNYELLEKKGSFRVDDKESKNIYEMICRQELVKKELLESKKSFTEAWASSENLKNLAGLLYESDMDKIIRGLSDTIEEVPYFAFVSKKNIYESVKNTLSISESVEIPDDHIRKYASKLFELKTPVKKQLISVLNEKYGINIQNLKEPPSFKSLINTQVVIVEALSRISPKNSIQKQVLKEFASVLKTKSGVQSIDVNDCLKLIFEKSGLLSIFENDLINQWDETYPNVEDSSFPQEVLEKDEEEETMEEQDEPEGEEPAEEEDTPQEPDEMEEDPEEDPDQKEDNAATPETEVSKEDFMEAMKDLEDLLGDLNSESETPDEENN
jgi:hypothetical protein